MTSVQILTIVYTWYPTAFFIDLTIHSIMVWRQGS